MGNIRSWKAVKNIIAFTCLHVISEKRNVRKLVYRWNAVAFLVPSKPTVCCEDLRGIVEDNGMKIAGLKDLQLTQRALEDRRGMEGAS